MYQSSFSPSLQSLARALAGYGQHAPALLGTFDEFDGVDTSYRFSVYGIRDRPAGFDAVYVFARWTGAGYSPLYIGKANDLAARLSAHNRLDEAVRLGASHLLVHIPGRFDRVIYTEAERRLIRRFAPTLNTQHNPF